VRQLLTESILLALGGATLGLLIALWGLDLIVAAVPGDKPFWMVFTLDSRVLLFTLAVALGTGVLFGLAPALQAAQIDLQHTLKDGTRGAGATGRRQRLRNALVVAEVALSLVLLVGATLMVRSFLRVQAVDPGFDRRSLVMASTYLAGTRYDSLPRRAAFYTNLVSGLRALPGVTGVTAVGNPPLGNSSNHSSFTVEGRATPIGEEPVANWAPVMPAYATVMGIPLLQGRDIAVRDLTDSAQVVLVNRWLADRFWPGGDAVGKRLRFGNSDESAWMTVIGVVGNVQQRQLDRPPEDELYVPYTQSPWRGMAVVMRTATGLTGAGRQLRDAVSAADPQLPVFAVMTFEAAYRSSMWAKRLYGWMFGAFAGIALLLAAVGLYGVMAYMVTLRTHEIGVRMALGARARDVLRLVVRRGVVLTAIGVAIGLGGAFAVTSLLRNLLFGVSPTDLVTFIGIPLLLGAVALLASTIPALRAARIDPMLGLRYE